MFTKGKRFFLRMVQWFGEQQAMLVFCLRANNHLFHLCSFLMGYPYYIMKVSLIETLGGWYVLHIVDFCDIANDSIQWYIVCLIGFTIRITEDKPSAIVFLDKLLDVILCYIIKGIQFCRTSSPGLCMSSMTEVSTKTVRLFRLCLSIQYDNEATVYRFS